MATQNKDVFVQINNQVIQLEGAEKEAYLIELDARNAKVRFEAAEAEAKASAKSALLNKLGITQDEAKLLLS